MEIVDGSVIDAYLAGRTHSVRQVIGALTDADLRAAPASTVGLALSLTMEGFAEEARVLTDRIRALVLPRLDRRDRVRLAATRCVVLISAGDLEGCLAQGDELLTLVTDEDAEDDWYAMAITMLVRAACWTGRVSEAEALTSILSTGGPRRLERVEHAGSIALLRVVQGRLAEAVDLARGSLAFTAANPEHETSIEVLPRAVLGTALLEQGDVAAATVELDWVAGTSVTSRRLMAALARLGLSRIWQSEGRFEQALLVLDDAWALFRNAPARSGIVDQIDSRAARVLLATGDRERAAALVDGLPPGPDRAVLRAQVRLADGRHEEARRELDAINDAGLPPATRLSLALGRLAGALAVGESGEAEARAVLAIAEPPGYVFAVAEAGADVLAAVCEVGRRSPQTPYLERLLVTRPHAVPVDRPTIEYQIDALSDRERTVLRYLVTAMSYREIADDLYVSVNTVKTHVKHIIRKLHAESRPDAIRRARELGYL